MNTIMLDQLTIAPSVPIGLEAAVGNTPMLPLERISAHLPSTVKIFAKAEWFNPSGSVKDRPALQILRTALAEGRLSEGKRLLDSTSGNMGIAYATFAAAHGISVTLTLPSNASPERMAILRALGVELILTDPLEGSDGAMQIARQMAKEHPKRYYYANQYDNPANWQAHFLSTGPEIVQQTQGKITHFVTGLGTSGTLTGVARYLLQYNPNIRIIAAQPASPFHGLEGLKHMPSSHLPGIYDPCLAANTIEVTTEEAYQMVRRLAHEQGLFVGVSSGAAAAATLKLAEKLSEGMIVTIFPDAGFKYISDERLWNDAYKTKTSKQEIAR